MIFGEVWPFELLAPGRGCFGCVQDVPAAFWRKHGVATFDGVRYTLHGPLLPCDVMTATHTFGKQTFCSFTKGWAAFCAGNELKLGDTVVFTKISSVDFEVKKV